MKTAKNRVVLGLNAYSHDAGAALFLDGRLVFAAEEERFDATKHSPAFPRGAIAAALRFAGLEPRDIDQVAFCWKRGMGRGRKFAYVLRRFPRSLPFLRERPAGLPPRLQYLRTVRGLSRDLAALDIHAPITHVAHHRAHAAQAWLFGPADDAAILTADGMGEWTATATWHARRGELSCLARQSYPHSLGKVYAAVTQHLGFRPDSGEGKTTGLAAFGRDDLVAAFKPLVQAHPEDLYRVALDRFAYPLGKMRMAGPAFEALFGPPRAPESPLAPAHEDLAFALQRVIEDVVLAVARRLRAATGSTHLGLAGGLFLNCALNGRLRCEAGYNTVFAFPAAGDAGAAVGAGALVAGAPRVALTDVFWGDAVDATECDRALSTYPDVVVTDVDDPADWAATALANGKVIGWVQGRMEFGPRALGGRSILGDPRQATTRDHINAAVKFREGFRPLAPAVLDEEAAAWFEIDAPSPHMLFAAAAREQTRQRAPAVVHVDGTARVQTVADGPLRAVLEGFHARTGVPILLNTSLNVRGQPIARTAQDALAVLDRSALDALVIGNRIVEKTGRRTTMGGNA